jgi:hypothetical protein
MTLFHTLDVHILYPGCSYSLLWMIIFSTLDNLVPSPELSYSLLWMIVFSTLEVSEGFSILEEKKVAQTG